MLARSVQRKFSNSRSGCEGMFFTPNLMRRFGNSEPVTQKAVSIGTNDAGSLGYQFPKDSLSIGKATSPPQWMMERARKETDRDPRSERDADACFLLAMAQVQLKKNRLRPFLI